MKVEDGDDHYVVVKRNWVMSVGTFSIFVISFISLIAGVFAGKIYSQSILLIDFLVLLVIGNFTLDKISFEERFTLPKYEVEDDE